MVSGSLRQGFRSAFASGNGNLNKLTTVAILLVTSNPFACSDAFMPNPPIAGGIYYTYNDLFVKTFLRNKKITYLMAVKARYSFSVYRSSELSKRSRKTLPSRWSNSC